MSNEAIPGGLRRGQRQSTGSVKQVLNSLAFPDKAGPHVSWQQLPRTAQTVEGLIHVLQCLDKFFRGWFIIFCFAWHRYFPEFQNSACSDRLLMQSAFLLDSRAARARNGTFCTPRQDWQPNAKLR